MTKKSLDQSQQEETPMLSSGGSEKKKRTVKSAIDRLKAAEESLVKLRAKAQDEELGVAHYQLDQLKAKIACLEKYFADAKLGYDYGSVEALIGELVRQSIPASDALKILTGRPALRAT